MSQRTNYQNKNYSGKRLNLLISKDSYKALQEQRKGMKITPFIENLILNTTPQDTLNMDYQNVLCEKLNALINFNKKLFIDLNATFSNVNQIAYRLNLANLSDEEDELQSLREDKNFHIETKQILIDTKEEIQALKELVKSLIALLEDSKKQSQK